MNKSFSNHSFDGKDEDTLATLRHAKFMQSVTSKLSLEPAILPPSERAAHYHALRVHLQVAQWKSLDLKCLLPIEWGWCIDGDNLVPIKTDLEPAPAELLQYIRCKYKTISRNTCGTRLCSCRRNGLKCVAACGNCRGQECENRCSENMETDDDGDDDNAIMAINAFDRNIFDIFD